MPTLEFIAQIKSLTEENESLNNAVNRLRDEMKAVEDFVKPNWSNDMRWSDEIIIAIQNADTGLQGEYAKENVILRGSLAEAKYIISGFLFCIPSNKDWLDPDVERAAKGFIKEVDDERG